MNEAFRLSAGAERMGPRVEMVQPDAWAAVGNASRAVSGGQDRDAKVTPEQKIERLRESRDVVAHAEPRPGPRQPVTTLHVTNHGASDTWSRTHSHTSLSKPVTLLTEPGDVAVLDL